MEHCYYPAMSGSDGDHASMAMTYLVFAIAAADLHRMEPESPHSSFQYFHTAAYKYLDGLLAMDDIKCIQGLLLLSVYGLIEPRAVNVWHTTGLAMRTAIDLGMSHMITSENVDLLESEMRKRVFWCAYVMERSVCFALGRPMSIRNADVDLDLPFIATDNDLLSTNVSHSGYYGKAPDPWDTSTFVHVVKLRQLNVTIQETFFPVVKPLLPFTYYQGTREQLRKQLNEWISCAPRYSLAVSTFQTIEWLECAYHYALISFHRPTPGCSAITPECLKICADSSISIISLLGSLYAKNKMTYAFVSLYMLFIASVTMLYALQASAPIRQHTTKEVVQMNIKSAISLFKLISQDRPPGVRCSQAVDELGKTTLALFDKRVSNLDSTASKMDSRIWTWFGMKPSDLIVPDSDMVADTVYDIFPGDVAVPEDLPDDWNTLLTQTFKDPLS